MLGWSATSQAACRTKAKQQQVFGQRRENLGLRVLIHRQVWFTMGELLLFPHPWFRGLCLGYGDDSTLPVTGTEPPTNYSVFIKEKWRWCRFTRVTRLPRGWFSCCFRAAGTSLQGGKSLQGKNQGRPLGGWEPAWWSQDKHLVLAISYRLVKAHTKNTCGISIPALFC